MTEVHGNHGWFTVDTETGIVVAREDHPVEPEEAYPVIPRFDMEEHRERTGIDNPSYIDIVDVGYWYLDGGRVRYEPTVRCFQPMRRGDHCRLDYGHEGPCQPHP